MTMLMGEVERKNRILENFRNNKDEKAFMEDCYMWTLEPQVWMDIGLLNYPQPPKEWVEYENMPINQRLKIGEEFFRQMSIKEYLAEKGRVYAHNYGNWCWLKEMDAFFPDDLENATIHGRINEKLDDFNKWFSNYCPEKNLIKNMFNGKETSWS